MNWATLDSELLSATGTTTVNYPEAQRWIDLNKSYHFFEDLLTQEIGENFFYNEMSFATVVGQKEYTMHDAIVGNLDGTNKSLGVSIDYGDWLIKLIKKDINALDKDPSWYVTNTPAIEWEAFFTIQDNSFMIFPAPTVIGTGIHYIVQNLIDLTSSTTEADVFNGKIHKKYHYIIPLGAEQYCYIRRGMKAEAQEAESRLLKKIFGDGRLPWVISMLNTRQRWARIRQMPAWYKVNV